MKTIKELKKGQFFRLNDSETSPVWVRGHYCADIKKYECYMFDDSNREMFLKPLRKVFTDFCF